MDKYRRTGIGRWLAGEREPVKEPDAPASYHIFSKLPDGVRLGMWLLLDGFLWAATWVLLVKHWGMGWAPLLRDIFTYFDVEWAERTVTVGDAFIVCTASGMALLTVFWPVMWWVGGKVQGPRALEGKVYWDSLRLKIVAFIIIVTVVF